MPKVMHSIALGLLLVATSQLALAQDMPGAALMRSNFFGSEADSPSGSLNRDVRLAVDSAGNRYILWARFGILSMVPHQGSTYGYRSFVVKAAPDSSTVWEYAVTNSLAKLLIPRWPE